MSYLVYVVLVALVVAIPAALYGYVRWRIGSDAGDSANSGADWTTASIAEPEGAMRIERDR